MELFTNMSLQELEEFDPNVYWSVVDTLEDKGIDEDQVGEIEVVEPLGALEAKVLDPDGEVLFILDLNPDDGSILEVHDV